MPLNKPYVSPLNHYYHVNSPAIHLSIFLSPQPFAAPLPVMKPVASQINDAVDAFFHLRQLQLACVISRYDTIDLFPCFHHNNIDYIGQKFKYRDVSLFLFPCFNLFVHYDKCDEWFLHYKFVIFHIAMGYVYDEI